MPRIGVAVACLALLGLAAPAPAAAEAVPGELIVRFEPGVSSSDRADARADADVTLERGSRLPGTQLVQAEPGQSVAAADRELEADSRVRYAEPNTVVRTASTPNDPLFGSLWGLHNTGQSGGTADADIDAPQAWDLTRGDPSVVVAVADSGVAYDHPDLASRVWQNTVEAQGQSGVDDDGNGVVDDVRGWDAIDRDTDPRDYEDHGTHVAGTVGAAGGNGVGVTGTAQDVRLMPVRVVRPDGGTSLALAEGFDYAANNGADVVNASLSGDGVSATVQNAVSAHPDTLFVVAAGNDGDDIDTSPGPTQYPCNVTTDNLVCVAATDRNDGVASFSNVGATSVDLFAPGAGVRSSVPVFDPLPGSADNFEVSNFASRWTAEGAWARTGERSASGSFSAADSPGAAYANGADASVKSAAPYDLSGRTGCFVRFRMRLRTQFDRDFLRVETSADGTSWTEQESFSGSNARAGFDGFDEYAVGLDGLSSQAHVRFRLTSDGSQVADGVHLDDVGVLCAGSSYPNSSYLSFDGTSMATPHVSGTAALVKSLRPGASVADLRAAVLDGDQVPGLSGTVTNRRLNAFRALRHGGPLAVTDEANPVGAAAATLRAKVHPVGSQASYRFEYGTDTSYGSETSPETLSAGTAEQAVSTDVTGLQPGTTYHYRVVASANGVERAGEDRSFTTSLGPNPPGQVQGVEATPGPEEITLDWEDTSEATRYEVFVRPQTEPGYGGAPTASPTASSYTVTGLPEGQAFCFKVRAVNLDGPGPDSVESCDVPQGRPPAPVGNLTAIAGVRSASLSWTAAAGADGYEVWRRRATDLAYPALPVASVTGSSRTDSGLTAGVTYCYKVRAGNEWGFGGYSPERCVTAKAPASPPPTQPSSPPAQPAPTPPAEPSAAVDLSRANRTLRASRTGLFAFSFRATPRLSGRVSFATARRVRLTRRSRLRTARLGSRSFRASDGGTVRVRIRLGRRSRALLKRSRRLRVKATVSASGERRTRTFVLNAPRK